MLQTNVIGKEAVTFAVAVKVAVAPTAPVVDPASVTVIGAAAKTVFVSTETFGLAGSGSAPHSRAVFVTTPAAAGAVAPRVKVTPVCAFRVPTVHLTCGPMIS